MSKPVSRICKNKGTDQCAADKRLRFRYIDRKIPLLSKSEISSRDLAMHLHGGCTARFVSDLVGNPEDRFSRDEAH